MHNEHNNLGENEFQLPKNLNVKLSRNVKILGISELGIVLII